MDAIEITVKQNDSELRLTIPLDSSIFDMAEHLKTILTFISFSPETISEIITADEDYEGSLN